MSPWQLAAHTQGSQEGEREREREREECIDPMWTAATKTLTTTAAAATIHTHPVKRCSTHASNVKGDLA